MRKKMRERLRRRPSSRRSAPTSGPLTRRLRAVAAVVLPLTLALLGLTFTGASALGAQQAQAAKPVVSELTTNSVTDPLGIDSSQPLLGWVINSAARGVSQGKYEIRVATNENNLVSGQHLVWDSRTVASAQSFNVPYGGPALASTTRYY